MSFFTETERSGTSEKVCEKCVLMALMAVFFMWNL